MIFGKIKEINTYKGLSKNMDRAIESILTGEYKNGNVGKNVVDGDNVFFNFQDTKTKDVSEGLYETHKKYIDIQVVVDGVENYGVLLSTEGLDETSAYDEAGDCALYTGKSPEVMTLTSEDFAVFFPEEPHMPCLKVGEVAPLKKVIYKVAVK